MTPPVSMIASPRLIPLRSLSDERLAAIVARTGDESAFEVLYARYREALSRYCRSIVRDAEDARDAQQNAFVSAYRGLRRRPLEGRVKPWLYRIAHNESVNVLRRRREHDPLPADVPSAGEPLAARLEAWETLIDDLRSLSDSQRSALLMRELAGLEYEEIGVALTISAVAARKSVFEARHALSQTAAGRSLACEEVRLKLGTSDRRVLRGRTIRGHLDTCAPCARFAQSMHERQRILATVPALPATAAGALGAGAAGAGAAAAGGGGSVGAGAGGGVAGSGLVIKAIAVCGACAVAGAGLAVTGGPSARPDHHRAVLVALAHPHASRRVARRRAVSRPPAHHASRVAATRPATRSRAVSREDFATHDPGAAVAALLPRTGADGHAAGRRSKLGVGSIGATNATPITAGTRSPIAAETPNPREHRAPVQRPRNQTVAMQATNAPLTGDRLDIAFLQDLLDAAEKIPSPQLAPFEQAAQNTLNDASADVTQLQSSSVALAMALSADDPSGQQVVANLLASVAYGAESNPAAVALDALLQSLPHP